MQVECKKAQPKEVMLPVNAARGRAATLRAGYGELLLLSAAAAASGTHTTSAAAAAANAASTGPSPISLSPSVNHVAHIPNSLSATNYHQTGPSPGKAAGLSAAAAALLGNGLVSYRYAPYPLPVSANSAAAAAAAANHAAAAAGSHNNAAAAAAANEALASMAGLAGLPTLHHSFTGLYPLYAAAATGHHAAAGYASDMAAAAAHHHHAAAVQAAVQAKQRVAASAGFLNMYSNPSGAGPNAGQVHGGGHAPNGGGGGAGGAAGLGELNLSSFAGLEGFYPVPVGL